MKIIILYFCFLIPLNAYSTAKQVNYEPAVVELTGRLKLETFPGPPNYESIKSGDDIETHYYLALDEKIDVIKRVNEKAISINDETVSNVHILQLVVVNDSDWPKLKKLGVGAKAKITGTLFKRHTGHHHSRVLFEVQKINLE